jgi:hypothetical protein
MMFDLRLQSSRSCPINNTASTQIFGGMVACLNMKPLTENYSLGILVWQCASGTFPFDSSDEVIEGPEAERVRKLISNGEMPWKKNEKYDPLVKQVMRVVHSCCNTRPAVRPSAASVAHSLFDILTCAATGIDVTPQINELIKIRVSDILDTIDKKTGRSSTGQKLSDEEAGDLQTLAEQGDPTASFLFGSAIWYRLVEVQEDLDEMLLIDREEMSQGWYTFKVKKTY